MSCYKDLWRIDWEKMHFCLPSNYEKRVHNGGIIIRGREEYEYLCAKLGAHAVGIQKIPCGQCIGCRLDYSRQWADRCMLEAKQYKYNQFVTLTYDDAHLPPFKPYFDPNTGEVDQRPMLRKKDLKRFLNSLRKRFQRDFDHVGIRFFGCGEYGELRFRPHFHVLLFNCDFPKKVLWAENKGGKLYTSSLLSEVWGKGIAVTADLTWDTCAYTARYTMKKQKGKLAQFQKAGHELLFDEGDGNYEAWQPEFVVMSRKPGIGRQYFEDHKHEIYATDEIFVQKDGKSRAVKPSRYYDKLYDVEYPYQLKGIKEQRRIVGEHAHRAELQATDLDEVELNASKERAKLAQTDRLRRPLDI